MKRLIVACGMVLCFTPGIATATGGHQPKRPARITEEFNKASKKKTTSIADRRQTTVPRRQKNVEVVPERRRGAEDRRTGRPEPVLKPKAPVPSGPAPK